MEANAAIREDRAAIVSGQELLDLMDDRWDLIAELAAARAELAAVRARLDIEAGREPRED